MASLFVVVDVIILKVFLVIVIMLQVTVLVQTILHYFSILCFAFAFSRGCISSLAQFALKRCLQRHSMEKDPVEVSAAKRKRGIPNLAKKYDALPSWAQDVARDAMNQPVDVMQRTVRDALHLADVLKAEIRLKEAVKLSVSEPKGASFSSSTGLQVIGGTVPDAAEKK